MSREIKDLVPGFREKVQAALDCMRVDKELKALGVAAVLVIETRRDLVTQIAYYCRGSGMAPEKVRAVWQAVGLWKLSDKETQTPTTWTLKSKHLEGKAVDLCPSKDGKAAWWDAPDAVWKRMATIAQSYGLESGYTWAPPKQDRPHFEQSDKVAATVSPWQRSNR